LSTGGKKTKEFTSGGPLRGVALEAALQGRVQGFVYAFQIGVHVGDPVHESVGPTFSVGVAPGCSETQDEAEVEDVAFLGDLTAEDLFW
jgi:hypothetical protein